MGIRRRPSRPRVFELGRNRKALLELRLAPNIQSAYIIKSYLQTLLSVGKFGHCVKALSEILPTALSHEDY